MFEFFDDFDVFDWRFVGLCKFDVGDFEKSGYSCVTWQVEIAWNNHCIDLFVVVAGAPQKEA